MTTTPGTTVVPPHRKFGMERSPLSTAFRNGQYPHTPALIERLIEVEDKLTAAYGAYVDPTDTYVELQRRQMDDLLSGKDLPEDLAGSVLAVHTASARAEAGTRAVSDLRLMLESTWVKTLRVCADEILSSLNQQLVQLIEETSRAATQLDGLDVSDADALASATSDQFAAATELKDLRTRYTLLRSLQVRLHTETGKAKGALASGLANFRNATTLGAPDNPEHKALWFKPLVERDDAWVPTFSQLEAATSSKAPEPQRPSWHATHNQPTGAGLGNAIASLDATRP